jgi:hypothetical protein
MRAHRLSLLVLAAACSHAARPGSTTTPKPAPAQTPAPAESAWSEATFAANCRAELARRYPGAKIEAIDVDVLRVTPKSGDPLEVSFAKAHAACREDWTSCSPVVEHTLAALGEVLHATAPTRAQLRIVLRSAAKIAGVEAHVKDAIVRPFSSDAQWLLAADLPDVIRLGLAPHDLGLSADEAWRIAAANVKPASVVTSQAQGVLVYSDDYAPSALLYPELLLASAHKLLPGRMGNLLAVCPEENIVLYTIGGASDAAALHAAAVQGARGSMIPLSSKVMEWTGSAWREVP